MNGRGIRSEYDKSTAFPTQPFSLMQEAVNAFKQSMKPHLPYLAILGSITLLVGFPLFEFKIMLGHDALAYLPRSVEFYQGLSSGHVFPRWAPDFAYGYGEPTFNFNPPVVYYLTALFHVIGFGFIGAQNLALFGILVLAGLGMYLLAGQFFGPRGGLVSAVAYLFAPYLLVSLYVRYALADFAAFAFIPFAFWGLYRYTTAGGYLRLLIGATSTALLILSSSPVSLITFPVLLSLFATILYFEWRGREATVILALARGLLVLFLGLCLSAFSWLPSLLEGEFVDLGRRVEGYSDFRIHFLYIQQLIFPNWDYGISVPGPEDGMNFAVGPIHILLAAVSVWVCWRNASSLRQGGFLVLFFLGLIILVGFFTTGASGFIWERLSILHLMQFPWRFLSLMAVSTAFVSGSLFLPSLRMDDRLAGGLMWAFIIALVVAGFPYAKPQGYAAFTDANISPSIIAAQDVGTGLGQLDPVWVKQPPSSPTAQRLTFIEGEGQVLTSKVTFTDFDFVVENTKLARLRVNIFYFPGWKVFVDESQRPLDIANLTGVMEFPLEPGVHIIQVRFTDTPIRMWSERLSLLALMLLLVTPRLIRVFRSPTFVSSLIPKLHLS